MQINKGTGGGNGDGTIDAGKLNPHDVVIMPNGSFHFVSEVRRFFGDAERAPVVTVKLKEIRNGRITSKATVTDHAFDFRFLYAGDRRLSPITKC